MKRCNVEVKNVAIYARVSTEDQSCQRQISELTLYAERCGYQVIAVLQEHASGAKNDRPERDKVMQLARQRKIDAVLVHELSRWGRNTEDLLETLQRMADWKVSVIAQSGMDFDLTTPQGKLMVTMLAGFAEFERALIKERVKSGVQAAIAERGKWGRSETPPEKVIKLLDEGMSVRKIARELNISPTTVQKISANRKKAAV
jgi:putative DNA-invertase from lambdoid prophage Rac